MGYTEDSTMEFATEDEAYEYMQEAMQEAKESGAEIINSDFGTLLKTKHHVSGGEMEVEDDSSNYIIAYALGHGRFLYVYGESKLKYGYETRFARTFCKEDAEKVSALMRKNGTRNWVAYKLDKLYN